MKIDANHESIAEKLCEKIYSYKCLICLDVLQNVRELACKHVFCADCLELYKEKNPAFVCPVCKADVPGGKLLHRDSAVDAFCVFLKKLRSDVRVHYNCDLLDILPNNKNAPNLKPDSKDIIQQSSEETDFIPATLRSTKRTTIKKRNPRKPITKSKNAKKPKVNESENPVVANNGKLKPLPILLCQPSTSKQQDIIFIEQNSSNMPEHKVRILRWLHDNRNDFERTTQTQKTTENVSQEDIELPSVSQMICRTYKKPNSKEGSSCAKMAQSSINLPRKNYKPLERRSVECSSPTKLKKYNYLNRIESIENEMIIDLMEEEVLDVIDKEVSGENAKKKELNKKRDMEIIEMIENKVIDSIDKQVSDLNSKQNVSKLQKSPLIEKVDYKKANKSNDSIQSKNAKEKSWPSANKFKKSLGTTKKAKNTVLAEEQDKENINITKNIDLNKMEEYFTRVIPKLIERNNTRASPDSSYKAENEEKLLDNDFYDLYIQPTQQFSEETQASKYTLPDILQCALKLQSLLVSDENIPDHNIVHKVFPIIKQIYDKLSLLIGHKIDQNCGNSRISTYDSGKNQQTDVLPRKSNEDVGVQTDNLNAISHGNSIKNSSVQENSNADSFYSLNPDDVQKEAVGLSEEMEITPGNADEIIMSNSKSKTVEENPGEPDENTLNHSKLKTVEENPEKLDENTWNHSKLKAVEENSEKINENMLNYSKLNAVESNAPQESEMQIEDILEKCQTQNISSNNAKDDVKTNGNDSELKENHEGDMKNSVVDSSQGSKILCSFPSLQTKVNRKLMFEKAMKERQESLQKFPTMSSTEDEFCNRFVNKEISIRFETETQNFSEIVQEETNTAPAPMNACKEIPKDSDPKHHKIMDTQADTQLLNYCDDLIEQANRKIDSEVNSIPDQAAVPAILEKSQKIRTQDLLKHCDDLIEIANQKIVAQNEGNNNKIKYGHSQLPTTSNVIEFEEIDEQNADVGTQALLEHCNALIQKDTKISEPFKMESDDALDDETLCKNLDKLDSDLLQQKRFSQSLYHEKTNDVSTMHDSFDRLCENINLPSLKRKLSDVENEQSKRIKIIQDVCLNNDLKPGDFNTSDDEMFQDIDIIESTPPTQKSKFSDRMSCRQTFNSNYSTLEENPIVPPPPGFDDSEDDINFAPVVDRIITQMESENIIPNSLSPEKLDVLPPPRKPSMNSTVISQNVPTLSQEFKGLSPIRVDKKMNVIELVQKSTFSPLTILPKDPPVRSPLTSTPKQKSILNYATVLPQRRSEISSQTSETIPCIAYTRLSQAETMSIFSLCHKKLATCQKVFGPEVTHLIVSVDKNNYVKDHTIKLLTAIAAGIWVLNIKWIEQCLGQNLIVDEEPYEVLDVSGIPSPRISRLTRTTCPLFKGFSFYLSPPFSNASIHDVQNVIKLLAGNIVPTIQDLTNLRADICLVISDVSQSEDYDKFEDFIEKFKVATVDLNWLSLCVCRYKILSIKPFLLCPEDYLENVGYPAELLADVPPSINQETQM